MEALELEKFFYKVDNLLSLHRQFLEDSSQFGDERVNMLALSVVLAPTSQEKFVATISTDSTLQAVLSLVRNGWPEHRKNCNIDC